MPEFKVKWEIDIYAESPEDAARAALRIQRDPKSAATVFEVRENNPDPLATTEETIDVGPEGWS